MRRLRRLIAVVYVASALYWLYTAVAVWFGHEVAVGLQSIAYLITVMSMVNLAIDMWAER